MKIAIVEDDISMRKSLESALSEHADFEIVSFRNPVDALKKLDDTYELIVTDITMPKMNGIEFIEELDGRYEIIVITGNATLSAAIESIRLGVKDFLLKPFEIGTLVEAIKRSQLARQKLAHTNITEEETADNKMFYGSSVALEHSLKLSRKAARTDASILLNGESGVGKEVFAKFIHQHSPRAEKPFVALNMAAIPEHLVESELFGYDKGAFTDALEDKQGLFETAEGGTLFLDEIGEMPLNIQAKILRVLQEREVMRVGSIQTRKIDVRIVSATNKNLKENIENKRFREDLYFRLNTIPVDIPPLRQRTDEILTISAKVLSNVCTQYSLEEKVLSEEAVDTLLGYEWPGNIRELISVIERAAILSDAETIETEDLFLESRSPKKKNISSMEKDLIEEVLKDLDYDLADASKALGMSKRHLEKKIEKYNL